MNAFTTAAAAWTGEMVLHRITEAATTLRSSKTAQRSPSKDMTFWPDAPNLARESYGYTSAEAPRIVPDAAEITRMDVVLDWMRQWLSRDACASASLPADAGWITWSRASGASWGKISKLRAAAWPAPEQRGGGRSGIPGGNSHTALAAIQTKACAHVATKLNMRAGAAPPSRHDLPETEADQRRSTMGRTMQRMQIGDQPCGTCGNFKPVAAITGRCAVFEETVLANLRPQHPVGRPCWVAKIP